MKYDFTSIMDRHGKDAIAVDVVPQPDAAGNFVMKPLSEVPIRDGLDNIPKFIPRLALSSGRFSEQGLCFAQSHLRWTDSGGGKELRFRFQP